MGASARSGLRDRSTSKALNRKCAVKGLWYRLNSCSRSQNLHSFFPVIRYIQKFVAPESTCSADDVALAPMNRLGHVCSYPIHGTLWK